jgi:hypothetical protein
LEEAVQQQARDAVRQLYAQAFVAYQQQWLAAHRDRYEPVRWRRRQLLTPCGQVELPVRVIRERGRQHGGYHSLGQMLWRGKATRLLSPQLEREAIEAATGQNYRPAAQQLSQRCGASLSHWAVWQCVQYYGQKLQEQLQRDWWPDPPRKYAAEVVVTEVDSTWLKWQHWGAKAGPQHFLMHLGLHYTGRTRRVERRGRTDVSLDQKTWIVSTASLAEFGTRLRRHRDRHYPARLGARSLTVLLSDGDEGLKWVREREFPEALWLLDRWHIGQKVRELVGGDQAAWRSIMQAVYAHDSEAVLEALRPLEPVADDARRQSFDELFGYLLGNRDGIDALGQIPKRYRQRHGRFGPVVRAGSGAVEKNVEVQINRRFKRQGRGWNPVRADRLAQLRWLQQHRRNWNHWWDKTCLTPTKLNPGWPSTDN